jgi:hypothetical protein
MIDRLRSRSAFAATVIAATLIAALACAAPAAGKEASAALRDSAGVLASDQIVEGTAAYCDQQAPAEGAKLRTAQAQWRQRHDVESVRQRQPAASSAMSADATRGLHERMAAQGQPAKACAQMIAALGNADMNLRQRYPAAYAAPSAAAPSTAAAAGPATGAANTTRPAAATASAAPGTLLLNPAQLAAIVERTPYVKDRSQRQRLQAAGLAGDIAIKGRVVKRGEHFFIDHEEGAFHSKLRVSPGVNLKAYEGREVVVAGRLDEWPSSLAFLRNARLVDGSGLKPSAEPTAPGMTRMAVEADRVRTPPGKGLGSGDVAGVLYHGRGGYVGVSYQFIETAIVLLRDGWAYERHDVPPSDLNVKASRELEPQRWSKWRRAGSGYELQRHDEQGRPKGQWQKAEGSLKGPWPAGTRLRGSYNAVAFHGSVALGGMYFSNTHVFRDDGGWEDSRFARGYSGGMAANSGFNSSTASHSDKTGTQSSSGTTSAASPTAAPNVTVTTQGKRDDGAEHRGRYAIDGYTLEIRRDNGRVDRYLTFKSVGEGLFISDRTFSPPKK